MSKEQPMDIEKKTKLIYTIELLFFAVVFFVIATLELLGIIGKNKIMHQVFNWVTIFGGTWMIADFLWVLLSKKRRAKNSLFDKTLLIPLGIYFIVFDILCFIKIPQASLEDLSWRRMMMSFAFFYAGAIYIAQAIYHWFHPIPMLVKAIEEEKKMMEEEKAKEEEQPKTEDVLENEEKTVEDGQDNPKD